MDEAGRGPLAGPVVAAAVAFDSQPCVEGLADSKRLTPSLREALFEEITRTAAAVSIGMANSHEIDEHNILQATFLAMRRAYTALNYEVTEIWVDGNQDPGLPVVTRTIVEGDALVPAISAASVIAKVTRDRLMVRFDETYPGYGFAQHKGYPTAAHLAQLAALGPCSIHRYSFKPVRTVVDALSGLAT
ncbi:MAG: ribonuclease HII [Gammaproteobacteria bacterium]|nr:ribonuclease HII [Gammaproteobacteria bacterium]